MADPGNKILSNCNKIVYYGLFWVTKYENKNFCKKAKNWKKNYLKDKYDQTKMLYKNNNN